MTATRNKYIEKKVVVCSRCKGIGILKENMEPVGETSCVCEFCEGSGRRLITITTETEPYKPENIGEEE